MGIRIDPTPAKGNWKGALPKAIDALSKALGQNYLEAGASSYDAITAFRSAEESLEQRVWTLWRESLGLALEDFFRTSNLYRRPADQEEFGRVLEGILTDSVKIARSKHAVLSSIHLSKPTEFPLYRALREKVPGLADAIAPDHRQQPDALRRRLDASYQRGFLAAWTRGSSHFKPLAETFDGPVGEAVRRDEDWQRYYEHLAWQVEENPLFGQEKGGSSLAKIFVRLRCYWRELPDKRCLEDQNTERKVKVYASWLPDEIKEWLDEDDKNDTLRIITGGPGSGKSSSAKMLACDVALAGQYNVCFVPLHGLDVSTSIEQIVDSYVQWALLSHGGLPESPLKWLRTDYKPLLLIFDGLDEVARPDREGPEVTRKFVSSLRHWLGGANVGRKLKVKALTLGRPRAAEDAADDISLARRALIHVAPLCPLDDEFFRRGPEGKIEISDPRALCKVEQRTVYWENWTKVEPACPKEPPEGLFQAPLHDLTIEPLLLYLLIYSGYAGENWQEAAENRNRVYEAIFRKVHERDVKEKGHALKEGLKDEAHFFTLMECLGLAAWRGGGRTGDTTLFEQLRDEIYAPERADDFKGVRNADLDNVALQFYARRSGGEQPGYTFIHKSFGEYLTARGLIEAGEKWLEDFGRRPRPERFALDWLKLTGQQRVTWEVMKFMTDEARLRVKRRAEEPLDWQGARERVEQLGKVAGWVLRHGLPAHGDVGANNSGTTWRRREQIQRNAEEALYLLIQVWAEAGYPTDRLDQAEEEGGWRPGPIKIDWPNFTSVSSIFGRILERRRMMWSDFATNALYPATDELFNQLSIPTQSIIDDIFSRWSLRGQAFQGVNLSGLNLFGSDLCETRMDHIVMNVVRARKLNFQGAQLRAASLLGAGLRGADLRGANLRAANLRFVELREADLRETNLRETNLREANLREADLRGADLREANLREANLSGADLRGADLRGADLRRADLRWARNLTPEMIQAAVIDEQTQLPDSTLQDRGLASRVASQDELSRANAAE